MKRPDPIATGGLILAGIVIPLNLTQEDRAFVEAELKWLFSAADHFLRVRQGELRMDQPVTTSIPADAERVSTEADNRILFNQIKGQVKDWSASAGFKSMEEKLEVQLSMWEDEILTMLDGLANYLNYLNIQLDEETRLGEAGNFDLALQNKIKQARLKAAQTLQELALLLQNLYGLYVTSPEQLVELLSN
jgi:hypothetical protein